MKKIIALIIGDKIFLYSLVLKGIQLLGMVCVLYFVTNQLNIIKQGFYFTAVSLVAMQSLFELGLGTVVTQSAARIVFVKDCYHLDDVINKKLEDNIKELKGLYKYSTTWIFITSVIMVPIMIAFGNYFIGVRGENLGADWKQEWILVTIASSFLMVMNLQLAFFEGAGYLFETTKLKIVIVVLSTLMLVISLICNFDLYSLTIYYFIQGVVIVGWLVKSKLKIIKIMINGAGYIDEIYKWVNISWKMQWRLGVSWICGYIAYQSATPWLMKVQGPEAAAEYGLLLTVSNQLIGVIGMIATIKITNNAKYVNENKINDLIKMHKRTNFQMITFWAVSSACLLIGFELIGDYKKFDLANIYILIGLLVVALFALLTYSQAVVLRSFGIESLLFSSMTYVCVLGLLYFFTKDNHTMTIINLNYVISAAVSYIAAKIIFENHMRNKLKEVKF